MIGAADTEAGVQFGLNARMAFPAGDLNRKA